MGCHEQEHRKPIGDDAAECFCAALSGKPLLDRIGFGVGCGHGYNLLSSMGPRWRGWSNISVTLRTNDGIVPQAVVYERLS
jgi:hypothetical protein